MIYAYIVDTTTTQVWTGKARRVIVQVNAALTGTIKVIDNTGGTTANVATITNPGVGNIFEYLGFNTGVRIIASTTCDITVSADPY
jgi:hypothetical protein